MDLSSDTRTSEPSRLTQSLPYVIPVLTGLVLAVPHLADQIWYDEAFTLNIFATGRLSDALTNYSAPNNHVVFSLLITVWRWLAGGESFSIFFLRLIPATAFLLSVAIVTRTATKLSGTPVAGMICGLLLATSHVALNFSLQIRGYSFSLLPVSLALFSAVQYFERPRWQPVIVYMTCACLAVGTIPTNVIPFAVLAVWLIGMSILNRVYRQTKHIVQVLLMILSPATGIIWYAAVFEDLLKHARGYPTNFTVQYVATHFLRASLGDFLWLAPLFLVGLVITISHLRRPSFAPQPNKNAAFLLLGACLITPTVLLCFTASVPFPRTLVPFLPLWLTAIGLIASTVYPWAWNKYRTVAQAALAIIIFTMILAGHHRENTGAGYDKRHTTDDRPQNLYDLYYHHRFTPAKVISWLDTFSRRRPFVAITDHSDLMALDFYLQAICPNGLGGRGRVFVYYKTENPRPIHQALQQGIPLIFVTHQESNVQEMADRIGYSPKSKIHKLADFGFFKIFGFQSFPEAPAVPPPG